MQKFKIKLHEFSEKDFIISTSHNSNYLIIFYVKHEMFYFLLQNKYIRLK